MNPEEILEHLLKSFERYYNINKETPAEPFVAEAQFHSHTEQYFLVKAAHLSDIFSNEYVYFAIVPELNCQVLKELSEKAWNTGLENVNPVPGHRNSDITLFIIAEKADEQAMKMAKKIKYRKSFMFTFRGWSDFRLVAMETSSKTLTSNRLGKDLKKLFKTIN